MPPSQSIAVPPSPESAKKPLTTLENTAFEKVLAAVTNLRKQLPESASESFRKLSDQVIMVEKESNDYRGRQVYDLRNTVQEIYETDEIPEAWGHVLHNLTSFANGLQLRYNNPTLGTVGPDGKPLVTLNTYWENVKKRMVLPCNSLQLGRYVDSDGSASVFSHLTIAVERLAVSSLAKTAPEAPELWAMKRRVRGMLNKERTLSETSDGVEASDYGSNLPKTITSALETFENSLDLGISRTEPEFALPLVSGRKYLRDDHEEGFLTVEESENIARSLKDWMELVKPLYDTMKNNPPDGNWLKSGTSRAIAQCHPAEAQGRAVARLADLEEEMRSSVENFNILRELTDLTAKNLQLPEVLDAPSKHPGDTLRKLVQHYRLSDVSLPEPRGFYEEARKSLRTVRKAINVVTGMSFSFETFDEIGEGGSKVLSSQSNFLALSINGVQRGRETRRGSTRPNLAGYQDGEETAMVTLPRTIADEEVDDRIPDISKDLKTLVQSLHETAPRLCMLRDAVVHCREQLMQPESISSDDDSQSVDSRDIGDGSADSGIRKKYSESLLSALEAALEDAAARSHAAVSTAKTSKTSRRSRTMETAGTTGTSEISTGSTNTSVEQPGVKGKGKRKRDI